MANNGQHFPRDAHTANVVAQVIVAFISIALYNVLELNFSIFGTFKKRSGLYFWSFFVATWGIALNAIGYLLQHLYLTRIGSLYSTLILIGWCSMVTGQSVLLYSRLHLVTQNSTALRAVLIMIITNAFLLHTPIIVLVYGSNSENPGPFLHPYSIFEKLQLSIFFVQETIISGFYIWETMDLLKSEIDIRGRSRSKTVMNHLIYVNIIVILLNISVVTLEFANYYNLQTAYKPLVYSIKLKMEFSILNQLVELTQSSQHGSLCTLNLTNITAGMTLNAEAAEEAGSSRCATRDSCEIHVIGEGNDATVDSSAMIANDQ